MEITLEKEIKIIFSDNKNKKEITTTVKELLENDSAVFYEALESPCNSSSCNNESQNFCDCPPEYENYEIVALEVPDREEEMREAAKELLRFKNEMKSVMQEKLQYPDNFIKAVENLEQLINK